MDEHPAAATGRGHVILVGLDGSRSSDRALAWAVAEARGRTAVVEVVTAYGHLDQPGGLQEYQVGPFS